MNSYVWNREDGGSSACACRSAGLIGKNVLSGTVTARRVVADANTKTSARCCGRLITMGIAGGHDFLLQTDNKVHLITGTGPSLPY